MTKRKSEHITPKNNLYRKIQIILNCTLLLTTVTFIILGFIYSFSDKKEYRNKGIEAYNQNNYSEAIEYFDKALQCKQWFSDSVDVDIQLYKAECYLHLKQYKNAGKTYETIIKKYNEKYYSKDSVNFLITLSATLDQYEQGDYLSTVTTFIEAVERGYTEMSMYAALCYEKQLNYEKMKTYYDIYSKNYGMNSYLYYKYSEYYYNNKNYEMANNYISEGLAASDTSHIQQLKYLQVLCQEKLDNFEYAFQLAGEYVTTYTDDSKGADIYAYLETRVNQNTKPINDIWGIGDEEQEDYIIESE